MQFTNLDLDNDILYALESMNFKEATPIQEKAIPLISIGKDILASAQTGTGKTAAFLLPIIDRLIKDAYPQDKVNCIIMVPTRELAQQIEQQVEALAYFVDISALAIYGGTDGVTFEQQKKSLEMGVDIVIATPGRLKALLLLGENLLQDVSFFVLDEADKMLDMGFLDDINAIIKEIPSSAQKMMFSATMPDKIQKLASNILREPELINIAISKVPEGILQFAYSIYEEQKIKVLKSIFEAKKPEKTIIFVSSKSLAHKLCKELFSSEYIVAEMHSDLDQDARDNVIRQMKANNIDVLVTTNIVARGIDIDNIKTVINYDVPKDAEEYVHRIGRTVRGNNTSGLALTFITPDEQNRFANIEHLIGKKVKLLPIDIAFGSTPKYNPILKKDKKVYQKKNKYNKKTNYKNRKTNNN